MNNLLLIWVAGGRGKVVLDIARSTGRLERIAFLDDDPGTVGLTFFMLCDCPVVGGAEELHRFAGSTFVVAVGDNRTRAWCFARALGNGLAPRALVHPSAVIAASARLLIPQRDRWPWRAPSGLYSGTATCGS